MWPGTAAELVRVQHELAARTSPPWWPSGPRPLVAGCFVCFRRGQRGPGGVEEPGWAAAVLMRGDRRQAGSAVVSGSAAAPYEPGLLALLERPSVGVTDRPLLASGPEPGLERGATSPLLIGRREVACALRTRAGARPVVVHSGWRTDLDTAVSVVLASTRRARTPEPLRRARRAARQARAEAEGRLRG